MPVAMAEILKLVPGVRLGWIIAAAGACRGRVRSHDGRDGIKIQNDVALQVDRVAEIASGRESNDAPTRGSRCFDGFVDGGCVYRFAVAGSSEDPYVEGAKGRRAYRLCRGCLSGCGCSQRGAGDPGSSQLQEVSSLGGLSEHDFFPSNLRPGF